MTAAVPNCTPLGLLEPRVASIKEPFQSRLLFGAGMAALSLIWGTQFLVIKIGQASVPPLLTVALRFLVLTMAAQAAVWFLRAPRPRGLFALRAAYGLTQACCMGLLYWSERRLSSALAGVLLATTPFFVSAIAHLFGTQERFSLRVLAATALGFGGIVTIALTSAAGRESEAPPIAVLAVLLAAVFGATNKVLSKRLTHQASAPIMLRDLGAVVTVSAGAASLLLEQEEPVRFATSGLLAFIYLGLVGSAAASGLYLVLLRRTSVTRMAYLQFVTAFVAALTGISVGGEHFGMATGVGALSILLGLAVLAGRPKAAPVPAPA
ncbi:MAG: EamA family transporter [Deltaproteobacteria bacterium]|nr:EamA family transporter [Deltaproteobacteria bacterium]